MNAVANAVQAAVKSWSPYQQDLFDWATTGLGNIIVIAVAGSGKSTTGVEMTKRMRGSHLFLAFNRVIADELMGRGVNGRTYHSLCYSPVLRHFGLTKHDVVPGKVRSLLERNFDDADVKAYGTFMTRLVGLARNAGVGCDDMAPDVVSVWEDLAAHHDLEPDSDKGTTMERGIALARELMAVVLSCTTMVDYDDMLYFAVKHGLNLGKFDNVLVDEAQDTNAIQRAILRKIMHKGTRLVAVGDPAQAIYGFRGADSNSMELLAQDFNAKEMPLTVTYRCPRKVVEFARQYVEHIEAAPNAPEGVVEELDRWDNKVFQANDLVVCRTTKPLVSLAYRLIRDRIPAHVMGREIGQGLKKLVERMNAKGIDALVNKLEDHRRKEMERLTEKGDDAKAEALADKVDCVLCIIEGLEDGRRTVPALLMTIDEIFSESRGGVKLATIHKAKGLEAERVFWLNSSKCPAQWAKQEWQLQQEENLCYVAITRAKSELYLIEETGAR